MGQITYANKVALNENPSIPDINKVTDDDMNEIKNVVNQNETKILIAVSDTAPAQCTTGDLYYNTTSKKIFVATDTNTWSSTGSNPTSNTIYILFDTKTTYSYDGTDLVSVGGGGAEVSIDTTQPTDDEKIWINPNETTNQAKFKDGNTWKELTIKALDGMPIGCIILFAGNTIPTGWLKCEGQSLLRTEYSELFGAINTIYGNVDSTHFNIPDYEGRVPVGLDSSDTDFDTLGETRGEKTHTLTIDEIPNHEHDKILATFGQTLYTGESIDNVANQIGVRNNTGSNNSSYKEELKTSATGGSQAHNNIQPSIVTHYIIKAKNTTPTMASIVDAYSTSTTDGYSANYVNEKFEGTILYNNPNGSTGDISLSSSISNFTYLEFIYGVSPYIMQSVKIPVGLLPNDAYPNLTLDASWHDGTGAVGRFISYYKISGTSVTYDSSLRWYQYGTGNSPAIDNNSAVYVYKVIGYK